MSAILMRTLLSSSLTSPSIAYYTRNAVASVPTSTGRLAYWSDVLRAITRKPGTRAKLLIRSLETRSASLTTGAESDGVGENGNTMTADMPLASTALDTAAA